MYRVPTMIFVEMLRMSMFDKFIVVLSPESRRSKWLMHEVRRTRKAERANNSRSASPAFGFALPGLWRVQLATSFIPRYNAQ